jgi:hypothetical protein
VSQQQFLLWEMKTDAAGGMAGGVDDLRLEAGDACGQSIVRALVQSDFLRCRESEPPSLHFQHVENGQVRLVEKHGCTRGAFQLRSAANVVDMRMSHDDLLQREVVASQPGKDIGDLVAGVHNHGLERLQICQQ